MYSATNTTVKKFIWESKRTKFKQALCEQMSNFCRQTANHGFVHLVDYNEMWYLRIAWAFIITVLAGIVIIMIHHSTVNLFSGSLTTEIFVQNGYKKNQPMRLPDVHICDTSIFSASRLNDMGFNNTMASYLTFGLAEYGAHQKFYNDRSLLNGFKEDFDNILLNRSLNMSYILKTATRKCNEIVWACSLDYKEYNVTYCCEHFFQSHTTVSMYGTCISTHGKFLFQKYDSRNAGFVVYIRPNLYDNIVFDPNLVKLEYILPRGIYYAVSSPAVPVNYVLHYDGRFAQPELSQHNNMELKSNLLAPYSCVDNQDANYKANLTPEYDQYSEANCLTTFWHKKFKQKANCSAVFYDNYGASRICDPYTIINIAIDADNTTESNPPPGYCPIECVKEIYQISPSYAGFNTDHLGYLNQIFGEQTDPIKDPIVLHFFHQSYNYQVYVNHVNSFLKFLGEIGGSLGLFLGASIISILEIVALLIRCLFLRK